MRTHCAHFHQVPFCAECSDLAEKAAAQARREALEEAAQVVVARGFQIPSLAKLADRIRSLAHDETCATQYPRGPGLGLGPCDCAVTPSEPAASKPEPVPDPRIYPCDNCGTLRSKAEGGTVFTVCDRCWSDHVRDRANGGPGLEPSKPCATCGGSGWVHRGVDVDWASTVEPCPDCSRPR